MTAHAKPVADAYKKAQSDIKGRLDGHYQHEGVKWMLERELTPLSGKGGILADDMGLGKTMQAIATMKGNPTPTLIITIVGTVGQWRDALIEFGGIKPVIVNPSFVGILPNDIDVILTTYSSFQKPIPCECFYARKWGRIILDEGHKIRTATTKSYIEIARIESDIKWVLSGTPIQNSPKDLMTLSKWIGCEETEVDDIVKTILLRRTQEEQAKINPRLALPGLLTKVIHLDFETPQEKEFYETVETYYSQHSDHMEAITRCRQACTHPQLFLDAMVELQKKREKKGTKRKRVVEESGDENIDDVQLPTSLPPSASKFNYLTTDIERVQATSKEKCLIFATWTIEMKLLQRELKAKGIASLIYDGNITRENKEAVLYNFNNTSIPVLILQINCGNAGLNLQCASRVYITTPQWNPCIELQAIGRAYRKGQMNHVTCFRLIMNGTIEERCGDIQQDKLEMITDTMCDESMQSRLTGN
jgi:SNF2 family DNA or RNA helicase